MRIQSALICDFAQVRNGLITIVSGGVNRVTCQQFPSNATVFVAVGVELDPDEIGVPLDFRIRLTEPQNAEVVGEVGVDFTRDRPASLQPGEPLREFFAINLAPLTVPTPGQYDVRIAIGGTTEILSIWFLAPE